MRLGQQLQNIADFEAGYRKQGQRGVFSVAAKLFENIVVRAQLLQEKQRSTMRILVFGTGVIGSLHTARFVSAGFVLCAQGNRAHNAKHRCRIKIFTAFLIQSNKEPYAKHKQVSHTASLRQSLTN
jgi:hypothetical protein